MHDYACIYFRTRAGIAVPARLDRLPSGTEIMLAPKWAPEGATHEVDQSWHYYDIDNRNGPWLLISRTLHLLLTHPDIEQVWYSNSNHPDKECSLHRLQEISEHFRLYGQEK